MNETNNQEKNNGNSQGKINNQGTFDLITREEIIKNRGKYQLRLELLLKEKIELEKEIKELNIEVNDAGKSLNKINEEKLSIEAEKRRAEENETTAAEPEKKREIEKKRWKIEGDLDHLINTGIKLEEIFLTKKIQLEKINGKYSILKEKILEIEDLLDLINRKLGDINKKGDKWKEGLKEQEKKGVEISPVEIILEKEENNKGEIEKEEIKKMDEFLELFYKKIWLMVIGLNNNEKESFQEIVISGGADFIPELVEYTQGKISENFPHVNVVVANSFINIDDSDLLKKPQKTSQFSNAIGAALKGFKN